MSETLPTTETYISPDDQAEFQHEVEPWLDSMVKRHGMDGRLTKLPFDPDQYPFQDMNTRLIKARIPSGEELAAIGRHQAREIALAKLKNFAHKGVGAESYEAVVKTLLNHDSGNTLYSILKSINQVDCNITILLAHANLQDIPLAQLVVLDSLTQAAEAYKFPVDIFDLIDQSFSYVSESMTRLVWEGDPVMRVLSGSANVVKVFPPTANGLNLSVKREIKKTMNATTNQAVLAETERVNAKYRSRLDYMAPAASSMDQIKDEGKLIGLVPKKVNPVAAMQITEGAGTLPLAVWFDKDMHISCEVLGLRQFSDRAEFYATMRELNETTARLAGTVIMDSEPEISELPADQ